jgi:hypothetical protein
MVKFVEHRIGDPRIINLIKRWLKAGVLENDGITTPERGTPQGGSISVLLSNIYLHYVLDLWFEKVVKTRLKGEGYLIRYIDDFIVCFQYEEDALRFQRALIQRLAKFTLVLELNKTRLVEFGRFAQRDAARKGEKPETIYFLGFTHFCKRNRKGNFALGRKTEKTRFSRSSKKILELLKKNMHKPLKEQSMSINRFLQGHYAYYGMGGNFDALERIYKLVLKAWKKILGKRSQKSYVTWDKFSKLEKLHPILKPRIVIPFERIARMATL